MGTERYSEPTRKQAIRLYEKNGWGYAKIAGVIGCYPSTIRDWVEAAGLKKHPGPAHSGQLRRRAVMAYKNASGDKSVSEVAREHGVHVSTLSRWLAKHGVRRKKARKANSFDHKSIAKDLLPSGTDVQSHWSRTSGRGSPSER
jgi:transposase-like protein